VVFEEAKIQKKVRQGCNLLPTFLNLYIEEALKKLRNKCITGINQMKY